MLSFRERFSFLRYPLLAGGWLIAIAGLMGASIEDVMARSTLESGLQQSIALFRAGEHEAAARAFAALDQVFGREPEFLAAPVQRVLLPMRGYASLVTGSAGDAVIFFSRYLEDHGDNRASTRPFVLFSLAHALQVDGRPLDAVACYQDFIDSYPDTAEAGVAHLRMVDLYRELQEPAAAFEILDRLEDSRQPLSLRQEGRLRALRLALDQADLDLASRYLLDARWDYEALSEWVVLAFAALDLGDYLLGQEKFDQAVAAYRLVGGRAALVERQEQRAVSLRERFAQRAGEGAVASGIWIDYYRQLIARVEHQLRQLRDAPDHTGPLFLRYGQAFFGGGRLYEARLLFEELAENMEFDKDLRQEAHYRWVLVMQELALWEEALLVATTFVERYPEAVEAPIVLFLMANAYQELHDYSTAIELLSALVEGYPAHSFQGRWLFSRGFNRLLLEQNELARRDFAAYLDLGPDAPLARSAALWHALAWHFEKQHARALEELDALLPHLPPDHFLHAETAYRRATVLYSLQDYAATLAQLDQYLAAYPEHGNRQEALVLRGDTLMGLGRLLEASIVFRQIRPEAGQLFVYAVFQAGKIFQALEEYALLVRHFSSYAEQHGARPQSRVSEALYWVGWAWDQQGRAAEAFPVFEEALARFGEDPEASELGAILAALHKLHRSVLGDSSFQPGGDSSLLKWQTFMDWVCAEQERALQEAKPTYYSRLRLYEIGQLRAARRMEEAAEMLGTLGDEVPLDALDAGGLAAVGVAWEQAERPEAQYLWDSLLARFPHSAERGAAYLSLGRRAFDEGDLHTSVGWLQRLRTELPGHPLAIEGALLHGRVLLALQQPEDATAVLEEILRLKSGRGRPHAEALGLLAAASERRGDPDAAIAYYQRVFNLYRGYPDLVGKAYLRSAELFEQRGDVAAAWRTYREILYFEELTDPAARAHAQREFERLRPLLPPEEDRKENAAGAAADKAEAGGKA